MYIATAVLMSDRDRLPWFIAVLGAVIVISVLYRQFIVRAAGGDKLSIVLAWWGAAQILLIAVSMAVIEAV